MKVTAEDIKAIPPGEHRVFRLESPKALNSAQVMVTYVRYTYPNPAIEAYKCKKDWAKNEITVTAIPSKTVNHN